MMTPEQFEALAALRPMRAGPARECTRLVMVEGMPRAEAARQVGISRQSAYQAVTQAHRTLELAKIAAGIPNSKERNHD